MSTPPESVHTLQLEPSPTGPMTLRQHVQLSDTAVRSMERCRYGNGFIPPGSIERATHERDNLRARLELVLEAHPALEGMYAEHLRLLNACYQKDAGRQEDVSELQERCSVLAHQIVALEESIDLGEE